MFFAAAKANGLEKEDVLLLDRNFRTFTLESPDDCLIALTEENSAKLADTLGEHKPDIVVVDPWGDLIDGDELSDADVRQTIRMLRACLAAAKLSIPAIIINHSRIGVREMANARGLDAGNFGKNSKCLYSIARYVLNIRPASIEDKGMIEVICAKSNDAAPPSPVAFRLNERTDMYEHLPEFDHDAWQKDLSEKSVERIRGRSRTKKEKIDYAEYARKAICAKVGKSDLMGKWREIRKLEQLGTPDYVPHLIRAGGHRANADALREMSPVDVKSLRSSPSAQTVAFLSALWRPKDYLHIFTIARSSRGKPGSNLMWQEVWVRGYQFRTPKGDGIIPNPFTGAPSVNADGIESYITKDCLAGYPYALVEFDALSLGQQCAFWLGFLEKSKYRDRLASLVYSGGKSIHALLHIDAPDIFAHEAWRTRLRKLFASNPDKAFCADSAGFLPRQGTRLAGVCRNGDGPIQELLYLKSIVGHP